MEMNTGVIGVHTPLVNNTAINNATVSVAQPQPIQPAVSTSGNLVNLPVPGSTITVPQSPVAVNKPVTSVPCMSSPGPAVNLGQAPPQMIARPAAAQTDRVLDKRRLQELVKEVDPLEQLDDDVEELLLQIADDFIDNVATASCLIAKHRKTNTVDVKDVQLHLEQNWNMLVPGFGSEELRPYKKATTTEAHKQRMALIKKTLKKY